MALSAFLDFTPYESLFNFQTASFLTFLTLLTFLTSSRIYSAQLIM
jgi:hypothetical protein